MLVEAGSRKGCSSGLSVGDFLMRSVRNSLAGTTVASALPGLCSLNWYLMISPPGESCSSDDCTDGSPASVLNSDLATLPVGPCSISKVSVATRRPLTKTPKDPESTTFMPSLGLLLSLPVASRLRDRPTATPRMVCRQNLTSCLLARDPLSQSQAAKHFLGNLLHAFAAGFHPKLRLPVVGQPRAKQFLKSRQVAAQRPLCLARRRASLPQLFHRRIQKYSRRFFGCEQGRILLLDECASSQRRNHRCARGQLQQQFSQGLMLGSAEAGFARIPENLRHRFLLAGLDARIQILKTPAEPLAQDASHRALARAHETHQEHRAHHWLTHTCARTRAGTSMLIHPRGFPNASVGTVQFAYWRFLRWILPLKVRSQTEAAAWLMVFNVVPTFDFPSATEKLGCFFGCRWASSCTLPW